MFTLCINTAGHVNTLALIRNNQSFLEENWKSDRNETETILPKLNQLLQKAQIEIEAIKEILIVQGVGGFTSLRVGISIANTFAYVQKIPIYAMSVFELWSARIKQKKDVAILIDAGRQEFFYVSHFGKKQQKSDFFYLPKILPNPEIANLKEDFWLGELREEQKKVLEKKGKKEFGNLCSVGEAFAKIDLKSRKKYQILEPWYGREPNISQSKK